jgi:acyl-coenzyme A synthetase/AMP-(fatty) acid ligase
VAHFIQAGNLIKAEYPPVPGAEDDPAYLLFTSGTTGEPKGVKIPQGNLTAYLDFMSSEYEFFPDDRFTQNFDLTFDLSVHDLFLCWSSGACLCVPGDPSSFAMAGFIREKKPTAWFSVPSVITLLDKMRLLKASAFPSIRISFFCGEALYRQPLVSWRKAAPNSRSVNLYGPTEATIAISRYEVPGNEDAVKEHLGIISIGRIFDPQGYHIHPGTAPEQGELLLYGSQVIRNYFRNPLADRDSFVQIPGIEDPCYRTGDLVTNDREGDLFYLGRLDSEVKISGYRVNLKEIENAVLGHEKVDHCVVLYQAGEDGQGAAAAFVTWKGEIQFAQTELDAYCRQTLPWYMVPGKLIFVDGFPLNDNGKIDKSALKEKYLDGK